MEIAFENANAQPATDSPNTAEGNSADRGLANPYLLARHEWDERYGSLITRAKNWRVAAILCASIALVQATGMIALSLRSHVIPYVVAVDSLGRQVAAGVADASSITDDRLKRAALFEWIDDLRTVSRDGIAQRKAIDRVYTRIGNGTAAMAFINEFYRGDPPQKRAETQSVSIEVQSVLSTSDKTYQVEWIETTRDLQGEVKAADHWKGAFTVAMNPPQDERVIRANPIGFYITDASWTRVF